MEVILPDGPDEEHRLLRDDGHLAPQVIQANVCDIDPVDGDGAPAQLHQPEQSHSQRGLSCKQAQKAVGLTQVDTLRCRCKWKLKRCWPGSSEGQCYLILCGPQCRWSLRAGW